MHRIHEVKIEGLWGDKTFQARFDENVNFLIGRNGSGKTTIINLISASLNLDISTLESTDFSSITFRFVSSDSRARPEYRIEKTKSPDEIYSDMRFYIRKKSSDRYKEFEISEVDQRILLRGGRSNWSRGRDPRVSRLGIFGELKGLIKVTWLPVYRFTWNPGSEASRGEIQTPVDGKIADLSNRMVRYFSSLESEVKQYEEDVQKAMFLSLLSEKEFDSTLPMSRDILNQEKEALAQIFKNFGLSEADYNQRLSDHFSLASAGLEEVASWKKSNKSSIDSTKNNKSTVEQWFALLATSRIAIVVDEWNKFQQRRDKILKGRERFLSILNRRTWRKKFYVNSMNELSVLLDSGEALTLNRLSSGEKQLIIVLGEALLQRSDVWIYIADEPELSLHVDWQECLVNDLQEINPQSQIVFATHSPDIVGEFDTKTLNTLELVQ